MKKPRFTVITCTYNRKRFLKSCLESVAKQKYENYEHIIVDGQSTDGTYEILLEYKKEHQDKDIRLFQREAKGIYDAVNFALDKSEGSWINILHSDDYYPDKTSLGTMKEIIVSNPGCKWVQGYRTLNLLGIEFHATMVPPEKFLAHQSAFLHRDLHNKYGKYSTKYKYCSDTELFLRMREKGEEFIFTEKKIAVSRAHLQSATLSFFGRKKWKRELKEIKSKERSS